MTRPRPRVSLVVPTYPPDVEAAGQRMQRVAHALRRRGASVTVITSTNGRHRAGPSDDNGVRVVRVGGAHGAGAGPGRISRLGEFATRAAITLSKTPCDVVLVDPPPTSFAVIRHACSAPFVYYLADSWEELAHSRLGPTSVQTRVAAAVERAALRRADAVIAVNDHLGSVAVGLREEESCVVVIPNGVPIPPGPPQQQPGGKPLFLYAGTVGLMQGADVFVRASRLLDQRGFEHRCRVVGRGAAFDALRDLARSAPSVEVRAAVSPEELEGHYRSSTAVLVSHRPSARLGHAVPVKALSALAAGRPVLFAGDGSFAAAVSTHRLGMVADWRSVPEVADRMRDLAESGQFDAGSLREWVRRHHDGQRSSSRVAEFVLSQDPALADGVQPAVRQ